MPPYIVLRTEILLPAYVGIIVSGRGACCRREGKPYQNKEGNYLLPFGIVPKRVSPKLGRDTIESPDHSLEHPELFAASKKSDQYQDDSSLVVVFETFDV